MTLNDLLVQLRNMPLTVGLADQIEILQGRYGNEYEQTAEAVLHLVEAMGLDAVKTSRRYIYDYLMQLGYFIENKEYGHADFEEVRRKIYDNKAIMLETYMPGLLLSYAYTTILYEKNHLFLTEFIPCLNESMVGIEIGFGEGFYLWEIFRYLPQITIYGYDISTYAIQFAADLLGKSGISSERFQLQRGNILSGIHVSDAKFDFGVLAELVEHIPNPKNGIREIARMLKKGGLLYLTTVLDSNHMDHISNFESPAVVEEMLSQEGFKIVAKKIYYMTEDFPGSKDISVGLAYVAEKL